MVDAPIIRVERLSFRYRGRKRPALRELTFDVRPGETLLVLGPSGSGKSTLTLCLNGLIPHSIPGELTGRVEVVGQSVAESSTAAMAQRVGLVFQDPEAQFCLLRVDDEIAFGLENLRVDRAAMPGRIERALDLMHLTSDRRSRIDHLSGGMRQRVALASVLAMEPPVLVFDEPTSNLDPVGVREVFASIAELKRRGDRTIVVVEHRLDELIDLVDRILVLGPEGTLLALGRPEPVLRDHAADLEAFGVWIPQVSEVASRLVRGGVSLNTYPITLDGAFATFSRLLRERAGRPPPGEPGATSRRSETASPAIEIRRLSHTFPSGRIGLREVDLTVSRGAFFAIVGPNGAGKSTLAMHLIGWIRPPPGAVSVLGHDVRTTPVRELTRLVGYVFQNPEHQFVARTVFDELAFGLRLRGLPEADVRERVEAMLADFGLAALGRANPYTLSHGEKRRLSVATMLILGQPVLILDEPTFGQDRKNTAALMAKLADLNRAGQTILMITHDLRLVAEYAHEAAVLVDGTIVRRGTPGDLFSDIGLLERAHLAVPPLLDLSQRLAGVEPTFPTVATVDRFVAAIASFLDRPELGEVRRARDADGPVRASCRLADQLALTPASPRTDRIR